MSQPENSPLTIRRRYLPGEGEGAVEGVLQGDDFSAD